MGGNKGKTIKSKGSIGPNHFQSTIMLAFVNKRGAIIESVRHLSFSRVFLWGLKKKSGMGVKERKEGKSNVFIPILLYL